MAGEHTAFDELLNRYGSKIYNMALRVTGSSADAQDATQSAFLKAYDRLESFDPSYRFFSWIYRIGLNEALNLVNGRRRFSELDVRIVEASPGPEQLCWGVETGRKLQQAITSLEPAYRAVVVLRHVDELSYQEMSEVLDIPVKKVKSRLFTARKILRERLARQGLEH